MGNGDIRFINENTGNTEQILPTGQAVQCAVPQGKKLYCLTTGTTREDFNNEKEVKGRLFCLDLSTSGDIKELFTLTKEKFNDAKGYGVINNGYLYYADSLDNINCVDIVTPNFLYSLELINNSAFHLFADETGVYYGQSASIIYHLKDRIAPAMVNQPDRPLSSTER
jgi:hypothetical protein